MKNKPCKLFPGISPKNEWWIDSENNFKSHFLCSCEVMRLLHVPLWTLEWMKVAQNTPKVYHWFKVIDGWSCLIVQYCQTIHHFQQILYTIVQYTVIYGQRVWDFSFSWRFVGSDMGEINWTHSLLFAKLQNVMCSEKISQWYITNSC